MVMQVLLECNRCGHRWFAITDRIPKVCAKCKSPYYNKERKKPAEVDEHVQYGKNIQIPIKQ